MVWKDKIDPELIELFLDRIYQMNNGSLIRMEELIADVALSGSFRLCQECTCPQLEEAWRRQRETEDNLLEMETDYDDMERKKDCAYDKLDDVKKEVNRLDAKINFLKNNSVIFSMNTEDMEKEKEEEQR